MLCVCLQPRRNRIIYITSSPGDWNTRKIIPKLKILFGIKHVIIMQNVFMIVINQADDLIIRAALHPTIVAHFGCS